MMELIVVFVFGLVLGASLGMVVFGTLDAARHADEEREKYDVVLSNIPWGKA